MKRFVVGGVVSLLLVFIGMEAGSTVCRAKEYRSQPDIIVVLKNDQEVADRTSLNARDGAVAQFGGGQSDTYVCACGGVSDAKGPNGVSYAIPTGYSYIASYQVISDAPDHFMVHLSYLINRNGASTKVDRMLPVWEKNDAPTTWSKLDHHFTAFACLSISATR